MVQIAGIDAQALAQSFAASGTVNETEGWVQNLNPAVLQNAQTQAQTALETYIQNNLTNPTVGDVIGGQKIIAQIATVLAASPPYRSLVVGTRYGKLPAGLQHRMTFGFGVDPIGEPINPVTFPWSRLNNHKVTLSFRPATAADEQALASLLPPGPITDPSQLPASIPSYLISVIPELAVDGQVVGQGNAMRLGEDLNFFYGVERVNGYKDHTYTYQVIAGSYLGIAVAGGSVSASVLNSLRTKLVTTQSILQSGNLDLIETLNRDSILGDAFFAGTLGYFGEYLALALVTSQRIKARHTLPFAYGTFGYEPNVSRLFGFPRAITPGGIGVNVRLAWTIQAFDGSVDKQLALSMQYGMLSSALEHAVPEQMFSTPVQQVQGVSAVKLLQLASEGGQRIYHITPANQSQTLSKLRLDGLAVDEITQALGVGKEVICHTDRIITSGYTGEGYIIFDPTTGDGAFKIAGGKNGGALNDFAQAATLSVGAVLEKLASLLKELVIGLFDHVLNAPLFGLLDFFLSINSAFKELANACDGALALAAFTTVGLLSVVGLIAASIFPLLYGVFFAFIYSILMRELILAEVRVCERL